MWSKVLRKVVTHHRGKKFGKGEAVDLDYYYFLNLSLVVSIHFSLIGIFLVGKVTWTSFGYH